MSCRGAASAGRGRGALEGQDRVQVLWNLPKRGETAGRHGADYDAFLEHQIPGTPHHELYRCAEAFELGACARTALTDAAAATQESQLADWQRRRGEWKADRRREGAR